MNKLLFPKLALSLTLLSLLVSACGSAATSRLPAEITLAAVEDLTGSNAIYATSIKMGLDLAVKQINEQKFLGEGVTLKVDYTDTASDTNQAKTAFEKLTADAKITAIIGPTISTAALAADPLAQQAEVPVVATSNTANGITAIGNYIFRTSLPESSVVPNTVKVVTRALGLKKVAIIYGTDDAFTTSAEKIFKDSLTQAGVEILPEETFVKGDTDFSKQLTNLKTLNPDAIIVAALVDEATKIMIQAREMGIPESVHFIGGNSFNSPKIAQIAGLAAEGAISGSAWSLSSTVPASQEFVKVFNTEYGSNPDQFAAQAYTAAWVIATAIKNAGSVEHAAVRDALAQVKDLKSPLGTFSFDANRDPVHEPVVLIVKNGKFEIFQP
jgi:branched-chain amino acid transport system substrate-binding protein